MPEMRAWRPTSFLIFSAALHLGALVLVLIQPHLWHMALGIVALNHVAICAAGLWPRSTLLGANVVRLSEPAIQRGEVALTFDDGPDPAVTPKVLAILATYGVKASFFCIGERAAAFPEICRAMTAAGHGVENHGQLHRKHYSLLGPGGWLKEVGDAQTTLEAICGERPQFFRALAGLRNPFLDPVLHRLGIRLASWTRRGYDTRQGDADRVLAKLIENLAAGDILLMHDGNAARTPRGQAVILDVLPRLLDEIVVRKLTPVPLRSACNPLE
jgi:peptidoglycan/xylan/chitin deacetylase (PgdA/CDA1 family)